MQPRFIRVRLDPLTPRQLLVLTNVITMTPGTLCVEVDENGFVFAFFDTEFDEFL